MQSASLDASYRLPNISTPVAIARGDGIGPEIMDAVLQILTAAEARIEPREVVLGHEAYLKGHTSGVSPDAWSVIREAGVLLKSPLTTPQGSGFKSVNVTLRKALGLYANVRPCPTYAPFIETRHPRMNLVVVRENEEDLYAGIEHRQTEDVVQCLKLVSRPGCERVIRFAFEYAQNYRRNSVTCMTKDNIMKLTDGMFHEVFDEIAREYPHIRSSHEIIDIGTARVATQPERYEVIVTPNLYGDILSDVAAEVSGSVGICGSANIGAQACMFEAVHGSAPDIAGRDVANPSGLLLSAVMMLVHIGQNDVAETIHNAWLRTIEQGIHTPDIAGGSTTTVRVGTKRFTRDVIARLGELPRALNSVRYAGREPMSLSAKSSTRRAEKETLGVDAFVCWRGTPEELARMLNAIPAGPMTLQMITNRGVKVWPGGLPETLLTDHWRCRFMANEPIEPRKVTALLEQMAVRGIDLIKMETLCRFGGKPAFSLGQGQ